jgi:hypothetical protein
MALVIYSVHIETPVGTSLGDSMNNIRLWLDKHKIDPVEFRAERSDTGAFAFNIRFRSQDEAHLFEQDFGIGASAT